MKKINLYVHFIFLSCVFLTPFVSASDQPNPRGSLSAQSSGAAPERSYFFNQEQFNGVFSPDISVENGKKNDSYVRIPISDLDIFQRKFSDQTPKSAPTTNQPGSSAHADTSLSPPAGAVRPVPDMSVSEKALAHPARLNDIAQTVHSVMSDPDVAYASLSSASADEIERHEKNVAVAFMDELDPYKLFFLKSDIEKFTSKHQMKRFRKALRGEDLTWMFDVFGVFKERQENRLVEAARQVDNWTNLVIQPAVFSQPKNWMEKKEQDAIWVLSVKDDLVETMLLGKSQEQAFEALKKGYMAQYQYAQKLEGVEVLEIFLRSYTKYVDPHSLYLAPRNKNNFQSQIKKSMEGVGVVWAVDQESGSVVVHDVMEGGPAARSGLLQKKDKLIRILSPQGMLDVKDLSFARVIDLLSGPAGTSIQMEVQRSLDKGPEVTPIFTTFIVDLKRERIRVRSNNEVASKVISVQEQPGTSDFKVVSVSLPAFYSDADFNGSEISASLDVRKELALTLSQNPDTQAVILDLRNNGGGILSEALQMVGTFLEKGAVVQVKNASDQEQVLRVDQGSVLWDGPLLVLINKNSASASEITAAALQDHGRAVVVGETSYGKGSAQTLFDIDAYAKMPSSVYGQLNVTTMLFFRPNGQSTQFKGVTPDVWIGDRTPSLYGERSYDRAIPSETVSAHDFSSPDSPLWKERVVAVQQRAQTRWMEHFWVSQLTEFNDLSQKKKEKSLVFEDRLGVLEKQKMLQKSLKAAWDSQGAALDDGAGADVVLREAAYVARDLFAPDR